MKDYLKQLIQDREGALIKSCIVREYLHARILEIFQEIGVFRSWAFLGGTAVRFLYYLPRYSEDLDFSCIDSAPMISFQKTLKKVKSVFEAENYDIRIKISDGKTVASAFIQFDALLFELGISPHRTQVLSIKVEVDSNPPAGATVTTSLIRRYVTLNLLHYDKESLLAGKIHALLSRSYVKGRDLYDIVWYLADKTWPEPNISFLNSALLQTGWHKPIITPDNWRAILYKKVKTINWKAAREDVKSFLEKVHDIDLITEEHFANILLHSNHS